MYGLSEELRSKLAANGLVSPEFPGSGWKIKLLVSNYTNWNLEISCKSSWKINYFIKALGISLHIFCLKSDHFSTYEECLNCQPPPDLWYSATHCRNIPVTLLVKHSPSKLLTFLDIVFYTQLYDKNPWRILLCSFYYFRLQIVVNLWTSVCRYIKRKLWIIIKFIVTLVWPYRRAFEYFEK